MESATGAVYLVSMPTKFRKNIWVKRGDFILVEPIAEGDKVKAEIVRIMNKDSIKYFKDNNVWPKEFEEPKKEEKCSVVDDGCGENDEYLFVNTNRVNANSYSSSDSESGSESCDSEGDVNR